MIDLNNEPMNMFVLDCIMKELRETGECHIIRGQNCGEPSMFFPIVLKYLFGSFRRIIIE